MRETDFTAWLEREYVATHGGRMDPATRGSRVSNLRRVEEHLGDLDQHWRSDQLAHLLDLLHLSRNDAGPKHRIPIAGDPYTGTATLRAAVRLYGKFCSGDSSAATNARITLRERSASTPKPPERQECAPRPLEGVPTKDLLAQLSAALGELKARGVMRTANNPVADYAEYLGARALDLELVTNSTAGHDAVDAAGTRVEIKARRLKPGATHAQLSAIRNLDAHHFDLMLVVLFSESFTIERASLIPYATVKELAVFVPHTNAWNLIMRASLWNRPEVTDATALLHEAAEAS
jgi:hypothetical protein